jgi:hypothetical protein
MLKKSLYIEAEFKFFIKLPTKYPTACASPQKREVDFVILAEWVIILIRKRK